MEHKPTAIELRFQYIVQHVAVTLQIKHFSVTFTENLTFVLSKTYNNLGFSYLTGSCECNSIGLGVPPGPIR